ncbi:MAG: prepilin-type N-terminal cleavage/methylation domain-containing protein [Clostridia bacterium]|nr:prepilin-type N-terminal cleavage/methylation domain-containing protein [Clostridia bacterium]
MKSKVKVFAKRRGFTIVELVIVIVVVAVLAAVAIPTLSGVVKEAKISVVSQLAANFNKAVVGNEATGDSIVTMHDAVCAIEDYGFEESDAIDEDGDYCVVWDSEKNRFVVFDRETKTVCDEENSTPITKLWQVVDDMPDEQDTSLYLSNNFTETVVNAEVGIDVGDNKHIEKIIYTDIDDIVKDIIIRINDPKTLVDDTNKGNDNVTIIYAYDTENPGTSEDSDTPDVPDSTDTPESSDKTEDSDKRDEPEVFDPDKIVAEEGKVVYCVSDGKQYDSLANAMTIGGEMILLADINECDIQVTLDTILDLRGFTVGYKNEQSDDTIVINGGSLIVKDSSENKGGKIQNNCNPRNNCAAIRLKVGTLIVEAGTIQGSKIAIYAEVKTSVTINEGTIIGKGNVGMGIYLLSDVILEINGGYITTETTTRYAIAVNEGMIGYSIIINGGKIDRNVANFGAGEVIRNGGELSGEIKT